MAPDSLMFFSVPLSSSALAWLAQNAAASARPITRSCFILTPPRLDDFGSACINRPGRYRSSLRHRYRLMQCPGHLMSRQTLHRLIRIGIGGIGGLGELALQLRADRRVEVQSLGRDLLHEPFVVQLLAIRALVERGSGAVDHLLE